MIFISFYVGALTLVQLSGAWLRYLPFSRDLSSQEKTALLKRLLLWSAAGFLINEFIFSSGINYRAYKIALAVGWLPYFLLSLTVIRNKLAQHIFVLGMQSLWCFMLHSFAGMTIAFLYGQMSEKFLPLQITVYLILFAALLPIERKFFCNLLPTKKIFEDYSLKWCISILPLAIFFGTLLTVSEATFLTTWRERFSRLCFPIFLFMLYRSMSLVTRQIEEQQAQEQLARHLRRQTAALSEHNALMQKSEREVSALRNELDANYRVLDSLLAEGKLSEAKTHLRQQNNLLNSTSVKLFCRAPLVNAALSIYSKRAEDAGIVISCKIDLPDTFETDESDLAVLLSNLMENAITASKKQEPSAREMSVTVRQLGGQCILEISNRFDFPVKLGSNGLPYTNKIGHGLGMTSLELFAKKYDAYVDFNHENNFVQLSLYWQDAAPTVNDVQNSA